MKSKSSVGWRHISPLNSFRSIISEVLLSSSHKLNSNGTFSEINKKENTKKMKSTIQTTTTFSKGTLYSTQDKNVVVLCTEGNPGTTFQGVTVYSANYLAGDHATYSCSEFSEFSGVITLSQ